MNRLPLLVSLALVTLGFAAHPAAQSPRPLTPDDLFKIEELGDAAFSPDGQWLAYVHRRPRLSARVLKQDFLGGNDRADIWLVPAGGGAPRNLTGGHTDGAGFWMPVWSPDGQRLAMLSTRGDNVRLWIWDRSNSQLRQATTLGVSLSSGPPFVWLSNSALACVLLPEGEKPTQMTVERRAAEVAMREWPKAWKGREATVSVLDSGLPAALESRPQSQLALVNLAGVTTTIASAASLREPRVAPDRRHVAFLRQTTIARPEPARGLEHTGRYQGGDRYQVLIADASGKRVAIELPPDVRDAVPGTLRWNGDGRVLAYIGGVTNDAGQFKVVRVDVSGGTAAVVAGVEGEPKALAWAAPQQLLVFAEKKAAGDAKPRADWWSAGGPEAPRNLTSALKAAPAQLVAEAGGRRFVGVSEGDLWRIDTSGTPPQNLTESFEPKIDSVVWPPASSADAGAARAIAGVRRETLMDFFRIDLADGRRTPIGRPSDVASIAAYHEGGDLAAFSAAERSGTFLTLVSASGSREIVGANRWLADIAEGAIRKIDYRSLNGQDLKGWLVLPAGYQAGTRYPLVVWVYAGSVARETPSQLARLNMAHVLNLQLLAARGYAVLLPSMPLAPETEPSDPYMEMQNGVIPAVDKIVELGIADPKRVGVMGQSYGGYSTYALVTQTNRFQAAIALAGLSDLVAMYGTFDVRSRYEPFPHERLFNQSIFESGQGRMGSPPWKDAGRYLRNSPLFYVDRVQTPLLIIQGDMDYVPIQQGEQFFTALYRQGKRARFIRYWGEGHVLETPANIRDIWQRIYGWLDEFLKAPSSETTNGLR